MIPANHPRRKSLLEREKIGEGFRAGIVASAGMIAHGRGEALDYLLGEKTHAEAKRQIEAAAAKLVLAKNPVISVNGNTTALCAKETAELSRAIPAKIEINLFYRTPKRVALIENEFGKFGMRVLGANPDRKISGLKSKRSMTRETGIYNADVVLVMLEDGDRTEYLRKMGKYVIAIDLNPLSRTARKANNTIVDNITRALPLLRATVQKFRGKPAKFLIRKSKSDNSKSLKKMEKIIRQGALK